MVTNEKWRVTILHVDLSASSNRLRRLCAFLVEHIIQSHVSSNTTTFIGIVSSIYVYIQLATPLGLMQGDVDGMMSNVE